MKWKWKTGKYTAKTAKANARQISATAHLSFKPLTNVHDRTKAKRVNRISKAQILA
jgi:hypothetical protein